MSERPGSFEVFINPGRCKGCGLCIAVCPQEILTFSSDINRRGVHPSTCVDTERCIGCLSCADICPDAVITVAKKAERKSA